VLRDGRAVRVLVTVGQSDGRHTEITGGALADGDQVITKLASGGQS
jgi:multidrug efflux pump subunit AcrA (membrane-fusion protein)